MRLGISLALFALVLVACVHANIAPPVDKGASTSEPCVEAPDDASNGRVERLYDEGDANKKHRCDASRFIIAVDHLGRLRNVYGKDNQSDRTSERAAEDTRKQIDLVLSALDVEKRKLSCTDASCPPLKILIFVHGGMVTHENAVLWAEQLAPAMLRDGYFPIFLIWNSGFPLAYWDHLCCVNSRGDRSLQNKGFYIPLRAGGDIGAGLAHMGENLVNQSVRFSQSVAHVSKEYSLDCSVDGQCPNAKAEPVGVNFGDNTATNNVIYPDVPSSIANGQNEPILQKQGQYLLLAPVRGAATVASEVGRRAWDDMVRQTRLALNDPPADRDSSPGDMQQSGGFVLFFSELSNHMAALNKPNPNEARANPVEITFIGHSLGAIVGNEMIHAYPELPYRRIVYMGAATSIREFNHLVVPVIANHDKIQFFNLMLHPLAESRELEPGRIGLAPEGSLLEWIDEMFQDPRWSDDRMLGKWLNAKEYKRTWPADLQSRMFFRVFPIQSDMAAKVPDVFAAECFLTPAQMRRAARCHPTVHGEFDNYTFWRDRYLVGQWAPSSPSQ
ncbi:MAG: hypothetical protein WAW96_09705 [Alphaproteobacteria bacterium]